jgi:hypothetical protein
MTHGPSPSSPSPDDEWREDFDEEPPLPRPDVLCFDVAGELIAETQEGTADSIASLGEEILTPSSPMAQLVSSAAERITAPYILLTRAKWSARPGEPPPREPIAFGAEYPNGRVLPSSGGFTLVLTKSGLMVYGRELHTKENFHPLSDSPCDLRPFAKLMALASITPGMIVQELNFIINSKNGAIPNYTEGHELKENSIEAERCCAKFAKKPLLPSEVIEQKTKPRDQDAPPDRQKATAQLNEPIEAAPAKQELPVYQARGEPVSEHLSSRQATHRLASKSKASICNSLGTLVAGLGGTPLVLASYRGLDAGMLEIGIFVAGLAGGWFISHLGRRYYR